MYSVFCAILHLVKGGIQWRMLPSDFPKRGIVRHYYDVWSEKKKDGGTALTGVLKKIRPLLKSTEINARAHSCKSPRRD